MGRARKQSSTPAPADVVLALGRLSKAALVDIVCDAVALVSDTDSGEPGDLSLADVADFVNPRLRLRGDRELSCVLDTRRGGQR